MLVNMFTDAEYQACIFEIYFKPSNLEAIESYFVVTECVSLGQKKRPKREHVPYFACCNDGRASSESNHVERQVSNVVSISKLLYCQVP